MSGYKCDFGSFFGLRLKGYQCLVLFDETISGLCSCSLLPGFLAIIALHLFKQVVNIDSGSNSLELHQFDPEVFHQLLTPAIPSDHLPKENFHKHEPVVGQREGEEESGWRCREQKDSAEGRSWGERHDEAQNWNKDGVKKLDRKERQEGKNRVLQ